MVPRLLEDTTAAVNRVRRLLCDARLDQCWYDLHLRQKHRRLESEKLRKRRVWRLPALRNRLESCLGSVGDLCWLLCKDLECG